MDRLAQMRTDLKPKPRIYEESPLFSGRWPKQNQKIDASSTLQTIFHLEETSISKEVLPFLNTHVEEFYDLCFPGPDVV